MPIDRDMLGGLNFMPSIRPHEVIGLNRISTLCFHHDRGRAVRQLKVLRLRIKRSLIARQRQFLPLIPVERDLDIAQNRLAVLLKQTSLFCLDFPLNNIAFGLGVGEILNTRVGRLGPHCGNRSG